ncbi:MAG: S41 family peptidase [Anaerolineales bacterium]|nr:S41 family peptidase [Anaerolineales bacterium]
MSKTTKVIFGIFAAFILLTGSFAGGFLTRHVLAQANIFPGFSDTQSDVPFIHPPISLTPQTDNPTPSTPGDTQTAFKPFWEVWNLIHSQYVSQPVDDAKLIEGAINGMLRTLDVGLNYYENPDQVKTSDEYLNGKDYEGIGAYVDTKGEYLTVISPIKDSPAANAGLRPRDVIIALDGVDMTGTPPEDVRQKVLGPAGTDVTLTIVRNGEPKPFDVVITRAKITTPLVESEMRDDGIAYVRLNTFGDTADKELRNALKELLAKNPKGLIFDLRYNGGGYLDQGIAVASEFLPSGKVVVYEKYGDGNIIESKSTGVGVATDIPMVVLVNEGSASASEIVAGALQDYSRAKLVGVITYGKGSVQSVNMLSNQGIAAITSAEWLTPNKRLIQDTGLTPDVYVEFTQEDFDKNIDPQLDAAVETINAMVNNTAIPTSQPIPATATATPVP